jgi:secondary thiamine-phosphate synthase enzyme
LIKSFKRSVKILVYGKNIKINTQGFSDIKDITKDVQSVIKSSNRSTGIVNISVVGSTASISTIEFEPALVEDVKEYLEKLVPSTAESRHSQTWGDDNGFSHIRSTLMGPSITLPFKDKSLILGTWQQTKDKGNLCASHR